MSALGANTRFTPFGRVARCAPLCGASLLCNSLHIRDTFFFELKLFFVCVFGDELEFTEIHGFTAGLIFANIWIYVATHTLCNSTPCPCVTGPVSFQVSQAAF